MIVSTWFLGGHVNTFDNDIRERRHRRTHSTEFKAKVVAACRTPGVSIASVALDHRLNANLVRRWVVTEERAGVVAPIEATETPHRDAILAPSFVPVAITQAPVAATQEIVVELRRGPMVVKVTWPLAAAASCGAWLREWLR